MLSTIVIVTVLAAGREVAATNCPNGTVKCADGTCAKCGPGCLTTCQNMFNEMGVCGYGGCDGSCDKGYIYDPVFGTCVGIADVVCPDGTVKCANGTCAKCDPGCLSTCQNRVTRRGTCGYGGCDGPCDKGYTYYGFIGACAVGGPATCPNGTVTCANGSCAMCDRGCLSSCHNRANFMGACGYGGCDGPCGTGYFFDSTLGPLSGCFDAKPPCNCTALLAEIGGSMMFANPAVTGTTKCVSSAGGLETLSCFLCCSEYFTPTTGGMGFQGIVGDGGAGPNLGSWANPH